MNLQYTKAWTPSLTASCSTATLALALILTATPGHAAFYKCVGADGRITYNDVPCAADQSAHLLSKSARELEVLDCRIARNFAFDAVARMRQDDSAADVFAAYGGAGHLSDGARRLINYVYTFQNNVLVSSKRIVDLSIERCQSGQLSKTLDKCKTFPEEFITRLGGCIGARQNEQTPLIQSLSNDDIASNRVSDGNTLAEPTLNAAKPVRPPRTRSIKNYTDRLNEALTMNDEPANARSQLQHGGTVFEDPLAPGN